MKENDSIGKLIVIDAQDTLAGITEEHNYIYQLCDELQTDIKSIDQKLIIENGKQYDVFTLTMDGGKKRILHFDISSFFGKL